MEIHPKPSLSWGGARLRSDRVSACLSRKQTLATIGAAQQAIAIGLPFNRFVTVHWAALGLTDLDAAHATGRLLKLASDWMRYNEAAPAWAFVRENDDGDGSKGSHVHIMLHCPSSLPIGRQWPRWLRKVTGRPYRKGGIRSLAIGRALNCYANAPDLYHENLGEVVAYCVKGVSPETASALSLPRQEAGGRVIGKRAGHSQNLSRVKRGS